MSKLLKEGEVSLCHHCVFIVFKSVCYILISVGGNFSNILLSVDRRLFNKLHQLSLRVFILVQKFTQIIKKSVCSEENLLISIKLNHLVKNWEASS